MAMAMGAVHAAANPDAEPQPVEVHAADADMPDWCRDWVPNATPGLGSHYVRHCLQPAADSQEADPRPNDEVAKESQRQRWADLGSPAVKVVADLIEAESQTDLLDAEDPSDVQRYNEYMERKLQTLRSLRAVSDELEGGDASAPEQEVNEGLASQLQAMRCRD
jgi:hypothetical protein